jgi:hypothetical protein
MEDSEFEPVRPELADDIAASPARLLAGAFHVVKLTADAEAVGAFAVFRDGVEVTAIVTDAQLAAVTHTGSQGPFRVLRFELASPFAAPGFLASVSVAIARMGVNQLLYSTWSFDYALVAVDDLDAALTGLRNMGFTVLGDTD